MKARIVFTDDDGNTWEHELPLVSRGKSGARAGTTRPRRATAVSSSKSPKSKATDVPSLDFSLPVRPFIKRYATRASGPRKFAILVARLANGDLKREVPFSEIERQWNKMTQLMGGRFNPAHASRAKDNGWVDSPKHGVYKLLGGWRASLAG